MAEFSPDLIHEVFKLVWKQTAARDRSSARKEDVEDLEAESGAEAAAAAAVAPQAAPAGKKNRATTANAAALKLSGELLRLFVVEAVQRAAIVAETEGATQIEVTHFERILPQLLLDF